MSVRERVTSWDWMGDVWVNEWVIVISEIVSGWAGGWVSDVCERESNIMRVNRWCVGKWMGDSDKWDSVWVSRWLGEWCVCERERVTSWEWMGDVWVNEWVIVISEIVCGWAGGWVSDVCERERVISREWTGDVWVNEWVIVVSEIVCGWAGGWVSDVRVCGWMSAGWLGV